MSGEEPEGSIPAHPPTGEHFLHSSFDNCNVHHTKAVLMQVRNIQSKRNFNLENASKLNYRMNTLSSSILSAHVNLSDCSLVHRFMGIFLNKRLLVI